MDVRKTLCAYIRPQFSYPYISQNYSTKCCGRKSQKFSADFVLSEHCAFTTGNVISTTPAFSLILYVKMQHN
jgi:hypothetical protein